MGWSAQYFTTIIIEGDTPLTGIFIYRGTPQSGTLIGSWTAAAGTDAFGNSFPAGINVSQGQLTGVALDNCTATVMSILSSTITSSVLNGNTINQGTINETTIIFDSGGGAVFGYATTTTTVTETVAGNYQWTSPVTGSASISCIGAGAGGDGGLTTSGGNGGGAGEYAGEPNYPVVNGQVYNYTVGNNGVGNSTGGGHGTGGGDTFFDQGGSGGGVYANGGNGDGSPGTGSTNSVHFDGGSGGGDPSGNAGGSSGGNSANKSAKGNNGITASSSSGAASPAAQSGSGLGGAGGNSGANGSDGTSPGAGGGGAGQGSGTSTLTKTYEALYTASYYGPDAAGGNANGLRSTSTMWQGGETASGGSYNGNQRCVMVFDSNQIQSDFAGYTPTGLTLKLTNQHSWYNSGMSVEFDVGGIKYPTSGAPSTWQGNQNYITTGTIAEGATHSYGLGATVAGYLTKNETNFLGLGAYVAADHPYDLNYYGYFAGGHGTALEITITGTIGSGSTTAGDGADGSVVITYSSSTAIVFALSAVAGTDANGNNYNAGYTGPTAVYDPNSPGTIEAWHPLTLINGWANYSGSTAQYRMIGYRLMLIQGQIVDSSATSGTFAAVPTGYNTDSQFQAASYYTGVEATTPVLLQTGAGAGSAISIVSWSKKSARYFINTILTLAS
jgi:hypothetical protein